MNKLSKVTFEYEDGTVHVASHEEAEKWQHNFDQMIAWSDIENNNWFVRYPVQFVESVVEQEEPENKEFDESQLFCVDQTLKTDTGLITEVFINATETGEKEEKPDSPAEIIMDDITSISGDESTLGQLAEIEEIVEVQPGVIMEEKPTKNKSGRKPNKS